MRVDKFLKLSRIIKRRQVAKEACEQGRITVNGKIAKPGTEVEEGDQISISFAQKILNIRVMDVAEHVRKEDAGLLYQVLEED